MLPTCAVSCTVYDQSGNPDVGATVTAKLSSYEVYNGYVVPEQVSGVTDAQGVAVLNLWPNQLGAVESHYDITIKPTSGRSLRTTATVPNQTTAQLHLIAELPPYEGKTDGQLILDEAVAAGAVAVAQAAAASASATAAASSATSAGASATAASNASTSAANSASASATSAAQAAGSALSAQDSASNASIHATTATTKADEAAASASGAEMFYNSSVLAANTATTRANEASASASAAAGSASTAQTYGTLAQNKATEAASSAASALTSKNSAEQAATLATTKADAAASSAQSAQTYATTAANEAITATTQAGIATTKASEAAASASAADLDAQATAADRVQTGLDAAATAADRVQTGIDAATATTQAAIATTKASEASASAAASSASANQSAGSAAQALAIYGDTAAVQTAVAQAAAQASLAAGYAASASSVVQQDLSGVNAAALHRSPNAVTAMFVYATQFDSDGGAWTEKCQHTSWYNEDINGKWLGAQESEFQARNSGATVSATELVTNGDFSNGTTGWSAWETNAQISVAAGQMTVTQPVGGTQAGAGTSGGFTTVVGRTYRVTLDIISYAQSVPPQIRVGTFLGSNSALSTFLTAGTGTRTCFFTANATTSYVTVATNNVAGNTITFDNISVREVTAQTTQTGDYFQLTTDGKFYKLNAGSGTTEVFRGNKRDFPRLAGIVCSGTASNAMSVVIYDLTEPGRPMWMVFAPVNNTSNIGYNLWTTSIGYQFVAAHALSGLLCLTSQATSVGGGLVYLDFAKDTAGRIYQDTVYGGIQAGGVGARNVINSLVTRETRTVANRQVNAVAMTVLPGSRIDPVTNLPNPTIAVATASGVSIIKDNGTVVNSSLTSTVPQIAISKDYRLHLANSSFGSYWHYTDYISNLGASFFITPVRIDYVGLNSTFSGAATDITTMGAFQAAIGWSAGGVQLYKSPALTGQGRTMMARISNTFNTGHQPGDIRRTYLSDNVVESVSAKPERVTNGDFDSATGWSLGDATVSIAGGKLVFNSTPNAVSATGTGATTAPTVGMRLVANVNISSYTAGGVRVTYGGVVIATYTAAGVYRVAFTATSTNNSPVVQAIGTTTAEVESLSIVEAEPDRSYKAQGATITGTLTKSAVASAAELVAYSGFSAANYLREPYSADLDFGTGEWSVGAWVNVPVSLPGSSFPTTGSELVTNGSFDTDITGWTAQFTSTASWDSGTLKSVSSGTNAGEVSTPITCVIGKWYKVTGDIVSVSGTTARISASTLAYGGGAGSTAFTTTPGTYTFHFLATATTMYVVCALGSGTAGLFATFDNISVKEVASVAPVADRAYSSGARIVLGTTPGNTLTATAYDGTTTRTVTTTAAYNTATWAKAEACYTTDGTLAIRVNGVEVAATRGNPLLTLNNSNAVLTIGNSFALDAPFPGSIALLKLSATVPTPEQSVWMYEQEKQLFRANAKCCLPDSGSILDLTYDDATDKWIAISAANESEWSGLVRTSVTAVPAGSYSKTAAASGVQLLARTTTNPGVDITIPAYGLREELVKRAEAAARLNAQLATFDYVGGFTATTVTGNTAITSVAGLTYPTSYIGARVSGSGIQANTTIVAVSGTTIYLSAAATASASNVQISFVDYVLPVGYEAKEVSLAGVAQREGSTAQFTRLFDGFKETIRFGTAPAYNALIQIQAARSAA